MGSTFAFVPYDHRTELLLYSMDRLLRNHWFDNQALKILDQHGFFCEKAREVMERTVRLAVSGSGAAAGMLLLADQQTRIWWHDEPMHQDAVDRLGDLAHILKEASPESGLRFAGESFFCESDYWLEISDFCYFNHTEISSEDGFPLAWLCLFDRHHRTDVSRDLLLLGQLGRMLLDDLQVRRQLEISARIQEDIIHVAAHDLRNPLAGILGICDHIPHQQSNPNGLTEISGMIRHSAKRMLDMLEEILKSGSLENGKIVLKISPSSFHDLLALALRNHLPAAESKGQCFRTELENQEILTLLDKARMLEVLDNLLSNAVKYAPKGAEIQTKTRLISENNMLEFSIYNPGVGLSEEDKSRIFQKFTRLSAKPTGGESSIGLGLSIVRSLTEMHGGSIHAESEGLDKGVRFILQLPVALRA